MATEGTQREFEFERGEQLRIMRFCQVGCPLAKSLLRTLDDHIGDRNQFWDLSFEDIAIEMNCSISCARDKANALKELALIDFDATTHDRKLNRFRITWVNLEETITNPVKVPSRTTMKKARSNTPRADCDAQTAPVHAHSARGQAQTAPVHAQTALGTSYKRQERQIAPPTPSAGAWEEVAEELSFFGLNCVGKAIEAAQRRGMTPEDVGELLQVARETPYHDDAARPAILYKRLTDWNEFYWAPPTEEVRAQRAAQAAAAASRKQQRQYAKDSQAASERRRQAAEDWQEFEQLPAADRELLIQRARSKLDPFLRKSKAAVRNQTLQQFREWREETSNV